ncbi:hypothetical protein NDU88_007202 [Pleurodeles waltl]|uniref:Reverse transcriptase zinc-binding domain-containing protein n=1 Tax=Pleurodeles waltl TaxID=8319 RepID=A0AAV7SS22_PLEWA|nr:hypothetical protein NDU88_007202 [Pleurodeles waltl]
MGRGQRLISWFADALQTHTVLECDALRAAWAEDAGNSISEAHWRLALSGHLNIPRNFRFRLIQFYIVHRAYLTPARVNRYLARQDAACPHCFCVDVDLFHMRWSCPPLCCYWKAVVGCLSECTARRVPFTWEACILGLFPKGNRHRAEVRFMDLGLITAKRLVTRMWKSSGPLSVQACKCSFEVWAGAEGVALKREEVLGLHKYLLSASWEELLLRLQSMSGSAAVDESADGRPLGE